MRRVLTGSCAFLALAGAFLVLPVYDSPAPEATPVETRIDAVDLGSAVDPAGDAVVTTAAEVIPDLVGEVPADAPPGARPISADDPVLTLFRQSVDPFSAVGVTWAPEHDVTDVTVRVRTQAADGGWQDWTDLSTDDIEQTSTADTGVVRAGTPPYWTGASTAVEVQVTAAGTAQPRGVQVELIDPGHSAADVVPGPPAATAVAEAAAAMPPVYSRAQWGADESIRFWDPEYAPTLKAATLHHTADANGYSAEQVPAIMRSIYAYHTKSRGWGDIGYNLIVDRFGRMWEGRYGGLASTVVGAHAGGFNTGTFGVSMLGNYETAATTPAMVQAAANVIAWKFALYGIDPRGTTTLVSGGGGVARYAAGTPVTLPTIFGHRDVGSTACPGRYGYAQLPTIRDVAAQLVPGYLSPRGSLDSARAGVESVEVSGWAYDPDNTAASLEVHVYVDGRSAAALTASLDRQDVAAAHPGAGAAHGYSGVLRMSAGRHQVCVYGINRGQGSNALIGCRSVDVRDKDPVPRTALDRVTVFGDQVLLEGWTFDEDAATTPLTVHAYVGNRAVGAFVADRNRPDVATAHPGVGPSHGFDVVLRLASGRHDVCLYAINVGAGGANPTIGCRSVTVDSASHSPVGELTTATVSGRHATVGGWVVDPDVPTTSSSVHLYVDGSAVAAKTADRPTSDVSGYAPFGVDGEHGFQATLTVDAGTHRVCAYGINSGTGANALLGCRDVTIAPAAWNPVGSLDDVAVTGRHADIRGWTLDFDRPRSPIPVHLYVDGQAVDVVSADQQRADVAAVMAGTGDRHGFATRVTVPAGRHRLCAYAVNVDQGSGNPLLGCREITIAASAYNPEGVVDEVSVADGRMTVQGWAFDADLPTSPIDVHVYVDGQAEAVVRADGQRPDVAAAFPEAGGAHGYRVTLPASPGGHDVCIYAINVGTGTSNTTLGCRTVTV